MSEQCWAVIPAAGVGKRMGVNMPKQYLSLNNKTILQHTIERFLNHPAISGVMVAITNGDPYWHEITINSDKPLWRAEGGAERCHSVLSALESLNHRPEVNRSDWVLVHDAARPCIRASDISLLIDKASQAQGGLLGLPVADTIKKVNEQGLVEETVDRSQLWRALTPQMFRLGDLHQALSDAIKNQLLVTDDASAMELAGFHPLMVLGQADNIKITHPGDLELAQLFMQHQQ